MPTIGYLIWISLQPILKLILTAAGGAILNRAGILTPAAAKIISKIIVQFLLPPLLFTKMVASISADNIDRIGILFIGATLYTIFGLLAGFVLRSFFRLPHNFRGGFVAATTWGNWGDMPLAVIMSIADGPPFKQGDADTGLAYVSVFLIVFYATLFPFGGHKLILNDFKEQLIKDKEVGAAPDDDFFPEKLVATTNSFEKAPTHSSSPSHRNSQNSDHTVITNPVSHQDSINAATSLPDENISVHSKPSRVPSISLFHEDSRTPLSKLWHTIRQFLIAFFTPANTALIIGLIFALIPSLKALFVATPEGPQILGVDGQPPLAFIYNTANFIANAAVPLGIMLLGSALSTFTPTSVPLAPALILTSLRLIITPALGIVIVQLLARHNIIPQDDKMLQFVLMFEGCIPSATSCVYLTQMYSPDGEAKEIAGLLLIQYIVGLVTITGGVCIMLSLLF